MTNAKTRIQDELKEKILDHYVEIDDTGKFLNPPKTDDELDEFITLALEIKLPRTIITEGHNSPFQFVADLFFERVKNVLGFANRNGGKTKAVSILNFLDMFFKEKCEVASAGAVLDQATKCYRYFVDYLELPWFKKFAENYREVTGNKFIIKNIQSWTEFRNRASLEVLTGTENGLRSPHPNKARVDEIDLLDWSILQTALSMAHTSNGNRGQNVFTSTRQAQNGTMQKLLDEAASKGIAVYEWNIWETLAKCDRRCMDDPEHGDCPIHTFCKGKAHYCDGFYEVDDFIDKVRILDRETWDTEWLNLRPSRHKLVYHNFDNSRHVMTPEKLFKLTGYAYPSRMWHRIGSLDFGSSPGHPFVYLKFTQIPGINAWLLFHEYVAEQRLIKDHAAAITASPYYIPGEKIFADWDAQDRLELRERRVRTVRAKKDVLMGIDYVKQLMSGYPPLEIPQLYIWHDCPHTISEFGSYSWPSTKGRVDRSGLPKKVDDHCMDGVRYAMYSDKYEHRGSKYTARTIAGI